MIYHTDTNIEYMFVSKEFPKYYALCSYAN